MNHNRIKTIQYGSLVLSKILPYSGMLILALAVSTLFAEGPIKSNLNNVLLYNRGWSGDHANTNDWSNFVKSIGTDNGFNVDITSDPSAFSQANLAKYDVIFLFNAYNLGTGMSLEQKQNVQAFYEGNRGLACFHQCVRHDGWEWYQKVMTVRYTTWASVSTAAVRIELESQGSDPAAGYAGEELTWNDEWYNYEANPMGMEGVTVIMTIDGNKVQGATLGAKHPLTWMHSNYGGRFVLNGAHHTNDLLNLHPEFTREHILGVLKFLAGYTGCMDETNPQYNPKATHNDPDMCGAAEIYGCTDSLYEEYNPEATIDDGSCQTVGIDISVSERFKGADMARLTVSISEPGMHEVTVTNFRGQEVFSIKGNGEKVYNLKELPGSGIYYVEVQMTGKSVTRKIMLF